MEYTQEQLDRRINEAFGNCTAFYRDTTLSEEVLRMYQVGIIFQEPTFCDATYKRGGLLAPHRYQIISSNAHCLDAVSAHPEWGLCIWRRGTYFKVLDLTHHGDYSQVTLLDIPEDLISYAKMEIFTEIEQDFVTQAAADFKEAVNLPPLAELLSAVWLDRLTYPLGIDDQQAYFNRIA